MDGRTAALLSASLLPAGCGLGRPAYHSSEAPAYSPGQKIACSVVYAVDGDTLAVNCGAELEKVRLIGIDAPEAFKSRKAGQDAEAGGRTPEAELLRGRKAANYIQGIVHEGDEVVVEFDMRTRDREEDLLGYVRHKGRLLNRVMLEAGYAVPAPEEPNVRYSRLFKSLYEEARQQGRGLWKD